MPEKIGVFGGGVLGSALKTYFTDAKIYDKYKPQDDLTTVLERDYLFICVPTPYTEGKGFDLTEIDDIFDKLKDLQNKVVIIKSTVLPGTTRNYQEKYPSLTVLFNPEFLTEATAVEDFLHPDKQLIGYVNQNNIDIAEKVLTILPAAPYKKVMLAEEAETVKYMVNNYYSLKVIFANQYYDICTAANINYEVVKEAFIADKRIIDSHLEIFHKGSRGFGGKCLPKDLSSMIDFAKAKGITASLLEKVKELNQQLKPTK